MRLPFSIAIAAMLASSGLAANAPESGALETGKVFARAETDPMGPEVGDTADDIAIWRNPDAPAKSLIIATDKKKGLFVFGLDGRLLSSQPVGKTNNVDLRADFPIGARRGVLVAASDRTDKDKPILRLFRLDTEAARLDPLEVVSLEAGREGYGLCLYRRGEELWAFMAYKGGQVDQVHLDLHDNDPSANRVVRQWKLKSRSEGCVVDDRTGTLYIAEDKVGIWRFAATPEASVAPLGPLLPADGEHLVPDIEGLALMSDGPDAGYLLAANQGANSFAMFRLPDLSYVGRFAILDGKVGGAEDTDGIELVAGDFGAAFPGGLFVAQDGKNGGRPQNFKLVAWRDVQAVLPGR